MAALVHGVHRAAASNPLIWLVISHFIAAVLAVPLARKVGRSAFLLLAGVPAVTAIWGVTALLRSPGDAPMRESHQWISSLEVDLSFEASGLSILMAVLIGGIGAMIFVYSYRYFDSGNPALARICSLLLAFAGAMLGLVLADGFFTLLLFWEATSVTSFFLIGIDYGQASARAAARQALLMTALGGIALLVGLVLLGTSTGAWHLSTLVDRGVADGAGLPGVALALVAVGCLSKSAQAPFGSWLPAAMAAPTPISAYLHSATMVKAGVYLIARLSPILGLGWWRWIIVFSATASMILAGWRAMRQDDLKLLLAHSTIAQLGLLCFLFVVPVPSAQTAALIILVAHALTKAGLFMGVGIIDHAAHTREISRLDHLARNARSIALIMCMGLACMIGLPFTLAFAGKEKAIEALLHSPSRYSLAGVAALLTASALTAAYSTYALKGALFSSARGTPARLVKYRAASLTTPAMILTGVGIIFAIVTYVPNRFLSAAVLYAGEAVPVKVPLLPPVGIVLTLSLSALMVGSALGWVDSARRIAQRISLPFAAGQRAYESINVGLIRFADRLAGIFQSGSLPAYVATIVAAGMGLLVWHLLMSDLDMGAPELTASAVELMLVIACGILAMVIAMQRSRVVAILLLGGIGYGLGALFIVLGAPDLALTQVVVETLAVVVFLAVIRDQPATFGGYRFVSTEIPKIGIAVLGGMAVFLLLLISDGYKAAGHVSAEIAERSISEAGARNVVNAILVDFRALDTVGEIVVLAIAVIGAATLAGIGVLRRKRA